MGLRSRRRRQSSVRKFIIVGLLISVALLVFQFIQTASNQAFKPLTKGDKIPDTLQYTRINNQAVNLLNTAKEKPVVLIYYQGGSSTDCVIHLNELNQIQSDIQAAGYQLIAVSPDSTSVLDTTQKENNLIYMLASDASLQGAKHFGIIDQINGKQITKPSVFVINNRGTIVFSHTDTDYKKRLSTDAILGVL
ncbi:redoxin domain-containing protein [Candidatus Marinamargulisbacteria bacterium]|nr:redoxin domain-containing protein [Candidatus Marinamargulisbacteria bacterium]